MKRTSDDLYRLIKSLDKNEKGYFRKFIHSDVSGSKKNYIELFDAIERQLTSGKPYNEELLIEKHKGEKFIQQLSFTKSYLYNIILRALESYDAGKTIGSHINMLINNVLVLFSRGHYTQSLKQIKQAKKFAYKNEQYVKLYDILRFERNVYIRLAPKDSVKLTNRIYAEQLEILDLLRNYTEYAVLYSEAFDYLDEHGIFKGSEDERKFNLIMKHRLMTSDTLATSFRSKLYFYGITYAYFIAKSDFENAYFYVKKQIDIQNSNPDFRKNYPFSHWVEYLNLLEPAIYLKKYPEVKAVFALIEKTIEDKTNGLSRANRAFFWETLITEKLIYNVRNFNAEKVEGLIKEITGGSAYGNEASMHRLNSAFFFISLYYFITGKYGLSLDWINKADIDFQNDYSLNYYSSIQILNILIHYELENYEVVESLIISISRLMNKNKPYYKLETEFLKTIRKLIFRKEKVKIEDIFKDFKKNISGFSKDMVFYNLDLISWAESKIKNKSFEEILSVKHKSGRTEG